MHSIIPLVYSSFIIMYREGHLNSYHFQKKLYIYTMKVIEDLQAFLDINWKGTQGGDLLILMYLIHNFPLTLTYEQILIRSFILKLDSRKSKSDMNSLCIITKKSILTYLLLISWDYLIQNLGPLSLTNLSATCSLLFHH